MAIQNKEELQRRSVRIWTTLCVLIFLFALYSYKKEAIQASVALSNSALFLRNATLPIFHSALEIIAITKKENPYLSVYNTIKNGSSLEPFTVDAMDIVITRFCQRNYDNDIICEISQDQEHYCEIIQRNEKDCEYWLSVKERDGAMDPKILDLLISQAYGIEHNGTDFVISSRYKGTNDMLSMANDFAQIRKKMEGIKLHALYWLEFSKTLSNVTRSNNDLAAILDSFGCNIRLPILYSMIFMVGPAFPFVMYYTFCILVQISLLDQSSIASILSGNVNQLWDFLFVDLWFLFPLEIVALVFCLYQEESSLLYYILKNGSKAFRKCLKKNETLYGIFFALPSFLKNILEAYRIICLAMILWLLTLRTIVLVLVTVVYILKFSVDAYFCIIGGFALFGAYMKRRERIIFIFVTCFSLVLHYFYGEIASGYALPMFETEERFTLENWFNNVPDMWNNAFQNAPQNTKMGFLMTIVWFLSQLSLSICKNILIENYQAVCTLKRGGRVCGDVKIAYYLEKFLYTANRAYKHVFWVVGIVSPFLAPYVSGIESLKFMQDSGWIMNAGRMFLLYMSQSI